MKENTITEILDEISTAFCDSFCKWPERYTDENGVENETKLWDEHCNKDCPLKRI